MIPRRASPIAVWSALAGVLLAVTAFVQPGLAESADPAEEGAPLVNQAQPAATPPPRAPAQIPGAGQPPVTSAQVTGTVTYRERIALPPNAEVRVSLQDVSRADVAAVTLGEQTIVTNGAQVPIPFEIAYDPGAIDERMTYTVRARITVNGQLLFTSTTATRVITRGAPSHVEIVVERV